MTKKLVLVLVILTAVATLYAANNKWYHKVTGMGRDNNWNAISITGYICSAYAKDGVIIAAVTVRTEPNKKGVVLGQFPIGTKVEAVIEDQGATGK